MEPNYYKVTVELKVPAYSLIDASKYTDKILEGVYKAYKIDSFVKQVSR